MNPKNIIRWVAIAGSGGYGIYLLVHTLRYVLAQPDLDWAEFWFFHVPSTLFSCGLILAPAYFLLRRQYQHLCSFFAGLAAVIVFDVLISLPDRLGIYERVRHWTDPSSHSPWAFFVILVGAPLGIAALWMTFYSAGWTFRKGQALLLRLLGTDTSSK